MIHFNVALFTLVDNEDDSAIYCLQALMADIRMEKSQVVPIHVAEASGFLQRHVGSTVATQGSEGSKQTQTNMKYIREGDDFFQPFEFHSRASDVSCFSDHTNFTIREFLAACHLGSNRGSVASSIADSDTRISEFSTETAHTVQEFLRACYRGWPKTDSTPEGSFFKCLQFIDCISEVLNMAKLSWTIAFCFIYTLQRHRVYLPFKARLHQRTLLLWCLIFWTQQLPL